jgi:hypothetical protein
MYAMQFTAIDPKGAEFHVGYFGGANSVGGFLEPLLVRLAPGETYELLLPLDRFICVLNRNDVSLGDLLRKGYSARATLQVSAESAKWSMSAAAWRGSMHVWTGYVQTPNFRWLASRRAPKP